MYILDPVQFEGNKKEKKYEEENKGDDKEILLFG